MGDAGAIVTNDANLARRMAMFARHGGLTKGDHQVEGINSRLDGLQAAILSVKLRYLPQWTDRRQAIAEAYRQHLREIPDVGLPEVAEDCQHVYHLYVIQHPQRDGIQQHLRALGIQTGINYPTALPFLPAYAYLKHRPEEFPVAFRHQSRILSLPMYPELTSGMTSTVAAGIESYRRHGP
jgi:dTDP-4-amino-4,6-dideoxygalactose transaminase